MNFGTYVLAATVHFVGIIAFMPQPSNQIGAPYKPPIVSHNQLEDSGVRLASLGPLPTISIQPVNNGIFAVIPQDFPPNPPVPAHTAMILYRATDYVNSTGLNRVPVARDGGLEYIVLVHGDLVTFNPGSAVNPAAAFPAALPHHPAHLAVNQLNLLSTYSPNNRTHSSVVSIPTGSVSVCQDNGRSDTTVTLNTRGLLVINIQRNNSTRTLTLNSCAEVAILNVPLSYATTLTDNDPDMNHYVEYCVMAGITDASQCPQPTYQTSAAACAWSGKDMLVLQENAATTPCSGKGTAPTCQGAMADCSNTQWP